MIFNEAALALDFASFTAAKIARSVVSTLTGATAVQLITQNARMQ
jgi:hypothetical protein